MKLKLTLTQLKVTKGTVVYGVETPTEKDPITSVYIRKDALGKEPFPTELKFSIEG